MQDVTNIKLSIYSNQYRKSKQSDMMVSDEVNTDDQ